MPPTLLLLLNNLIWFLAGMAIGFTAHQTLNYFRSR
jgi:hypothetical protein